MDRSTTLWRGDNSLGHALGTLPARSSSAPPKNTSSTTSIEGLDLAAAANLSATADLDLLHASGWDGSHVFDGVFATVPTEAPDLFTTTDYSDDAGDILRLGRMHDDALHSLSGELFSKRIVSDLEERGIDC